jgi:N-formylglutamate amidohydrolase
MLRPRAVATVWLALMVVAARPGHAIDRTPADLVLAQPGTLPIILTAPHGGREAIPSVEPRRAEDKTSRKWGGFKTGGDANTDVLAECIATEITQLTGRAPYLVVVKFQRKYVDANRPPELALEDPRARPYYDYYHQSVRRFIDEVRNGYPAGLLIDVHGQSKVRTSSCAARSTAVVSNGCCDVPAWTE